MQMNCPKFAFSAKHLARVIALPAATVIAFLWPQGSVAADAKGRLGFVVEAWRTAIYQTEYMEECPDGIAIGNDEIWFNALSPQDKERWTQGGRLQSLDMPRRSQQYLRGPQGEDVCWHPTVVVDPPMRLASGRYSFGMNLDNNEDGKATPKTCAHQNFQSPEDKAAGIDNQLFRLMGCVYGYRDKGYLEHHANRERQDESKGVILIDVTDVDDPHNDSAVTVTFYLSATTLRFDTSGRIIPFASYQTVAGRYGDTVRGRIVNDVLETEPGNVTLPIYGNDAATDMVFRDFRLRLRVNPGGERASGIWAGYHPVDSFWDHIQKVQHNVPVGQYDCPALYAAAHQLADGYPDPKTGQCTALSSAFSYEAVAAFVIPATGGGSENRLVKSLLSGVK